MEKTFSVELSSQELAILCNSLQSSMFQIGLRCDQLFNKPHSSSESVQKAIFDSYNEQIDKYGLVLQKLLSI